MLDVRSIDIEEFRATGFVVLRGVFDPDPLSDEVNRALDDGFRTAGRMNVGSAGNEFQYLPMMCETTPLSLSLLDGLARPAAQLLGRGVIPVRAKGTRYFGGTAWHSDSDLDVESVGFASYLEPLDANNGALRVVPGSHRSAVADHLAGLPADGPTIAGAAIATVPGDVIVFDEHLWHASCGGRQRRQWRVDFVADPIGPEEEERVRAYFASIFQPGWDGGYDVDRYPSYGSHWQASGRSWIDRLRELGAYHRASAEEAAVRAQRLVGSPVVER